MDMLLKSICSSITATNLLCRVAHSHKVNSLKFNTMESAEYVNKMGVVDKFALDGQGTEEPEGDEL